MYFPAPPEDSSGAARIRRARAWGREHPHRFTAMFVAVVFLVASILPIWTAWYFSPFEANGELATFWNLLASVRDLRRQPGAGYLATRFYVPEALKLTGLILVSAIVGRMAAGNPPPPEAVDYEDGIPPPGTTHFSLTRVLATRMP